MIFSSQSLSSSQLAYNMSPLANQIGKFVFSEPVMIVGADVTHWARGMFKCG